VRVIALDPVPRPLDALPARGRPEAGALADTAGTLSYAQLEAAVGAMAQALRALGLAPGDRVASWLPKTRTACLMPLAAARAGLVHVPVNPVLKRAQVAHILADSGARALITQSRRLQTLEAGDVGADCRIVEESALHSDQTLPAADVDTDALAAIL
jgi:acyl-coenzyme A synthetase/AMP-(fatty) acid ligase